MTNEKQVLLSLGLTEEQAAKYLADGGTLAGLRIMTIADLQEELGTSKNQARTVLGNLQQLPQAGQQAPKAETTADRALTLLAGALPQNLDSMGLEQLWALFLQDQGRPEVRARILGLTSRNGAQLRTFVRVGGTVDAALSAKMLASLTGKRFVPGKGYRFRGYATVTLDEALRVRELASPLTGEPLNDQGDGRLVDSRGVNWGPIMPAPHGNGRAVLLTLAKLPQVIEEWGSDLVPELGPKALIKELKQAEITEDDDCHRLQQAYLDAAENNPLWVREAEAMLECGGGEQAERRPEGFRRAPRS